MSRVVTHVRKGWTLVPSTPKHQNPRSSPTAFQPGVTLTSFFEPRPFQLMCRAAALGGSCSVPCHPSGLPDPWLRVASVCVCARADVSTLAPSRPQAQSCAWSPSSLLPGSTAAGTRRAGGGGSMDQRMDMDEAVAWSGCFPRFSCPIATRRMMGLDPWMGWLYLRRGLSVFFSLPGWMSSTPRVLGGGMGGVSMGFVERRSQDDCGPSYMGVVLLGC